MEVRVRLQNKFLQTCDIVSIYNKDLNMFLSVQQRKINEYFQKEKRLIKVFLF